MKALVKTATGIGNLELRDVPEPVPESDQLKVEVRAGAVCGTDLHIYDDEYVNCPPMILGHEMSGVIVEAGPAVTRFQVGDRVTSETFKYTCGRCRFCRDGLIGVERRPVTWAASPALRAPGRPAPGTAAVAAPHHRGSGASADTLHHRNSHRHWRDPGRAHRVPAGHPRAS